MVGALRASPAAAGTVGERLPRGAGALQAMAGAGRRNARDRPGDPGTNGSAGTLPGGVGGPATLGAGFVGKSAFRSGAGVESKAGEFYREDLEGSEKRAREAARSDGLLLSYGSRPVDWYRINKLKHSVSEERLEQVREIDGEQAYEKMRRAVEKASQEKARQEKARQEKARQVESRPERRGPERGGPERDFGPSR